MEQRVIKFRAWNHSKREWTGFKTCIDTKAFEDGGVMLPFQDVTLMQFTGLKDKNGREIYEGDITSHKTKDVNNEPIEYRESVNWSQQLAAFILSSEDSWSYLVAYVDDIEVIGNIYEHPELLKQA